MSLKSDLLKQARFGGRLLVWGPPVDYVARLDGATQYWKLSDPVQVQKDDIIKFKLNAEIGSLDICYILQSSSTAAVVSTMFYNNSDGKLTSTYMINTVINGNPGTIYIEEGGNYVFELTYSADSDIEKLFEHRGRYTPGSIYDFEQIRGGVTILKIPLTNRFQGATQLATVGNVNATMINYTGDEWEVVEPAPVINYVARLDGATQYWQLSGDIDVDIGGRIDLYFRGFVPANSFRRFIAGDAPFDVSTGSPPSTFIYSTGTVVCDLNGSPITSGDGIPTDGENILSITPKVSLTFGQLGAVGGARLLEVPLIKLKVYDSVGALTHEIPLTNKEQGATQLATVGGINATMINYTGDEWEVLSNSTINYVARLDGATQYWELSEPIPVLTGYKVRYKLNCTGGLGNVVYMHGNSTQSSSLSSYVVPSNSQLSFSGSINEKLDGVPFANSSEIQLGVEYEVEFEVNSNKDIATLFRLLDIEKYTAGYIYDFEVLNELGVVVNKIPLTNKDQGATQLATVGSVNATMINYTGDEWETL